MQPSSFQLIWPILPWNNNENVKQSKTCSPGNDSLDHEDFFVCLADEDVKKTGQSEWNLSPRQLAADRDLFTCDRARGRS